MFFVKVFFKPNSLNLPCILHLNNEVSYLKTETTNYFLYKCKQVYCQCIEVLYSHTDIYLYCLYFQFPNVLFKGDAMLCGKLCYEVSTA